MNRKLLWLFLITVSAHQLTAQPTITKKKSSSQPSVAEANNEQTYQATPGKVKWTAGPESMPSNLKAFQEYKGQFLNLINNWKILYGADYGGAKILFTDHGVIYTLAQVYKDSLNEEADKDDDKNKSSEEKEKEKQNLKKIVYRNVAIEWENVNANLTVEAQNETPYYFGSLDPHNNMSSIDHIKGFQKLVYHNVYPGIDVEYTFHKDKGIKYAVIVHPGYNASDFKMLYSGNKGLSIDGNGDVHIGTELGDIIDHAPISSQNGQKVESSFKQLSNNEVAFQVGSTNQSSDLIIDPWTVNPVSNNFLPQDVGMDGSNNVYIMGMNGAYKHYVQKYTTAGALSWTYSLTQYGTVANDVSDLAVDVAGNTYVPGPYGYTNSVGNAWSIISLNTGGTLRYFNNASSPANMFEVWNISYSCDYSELVEGGAPTIEQEEVGVVNSANGNLGGVTTNATYGEIYTGCIAPNGNYYAIAANPCFGCSTPGDDIVCYTLSAGTATFAWNKQSTYQWNDYDFKNPAGISTNGIAASCAYLYTTDGLKLDQRSLTNGTSVKTVTIPGGSNSLSVATGGLGVDMACGYVYAGTAGSVQVYDQNLNAITTQAMPGNVYDVDYNNGLVAACGGAVGSGFVTQFAAQTCATELTITHTNTSCGNNNGTATVATPSFCTGPYTYVWAPGGQTTQTITGLSAGIYTVNVGTSTSCVTVSDTVTIKPSTNVTLTATATGTCTGNVTITVSGGVTPYTYSWSNGATTANITGVSAGSYTITVTDAAGCVKTATATIAGGVVTITTTQVNELCNGGSTGSSIATASGGTAPYTYLWSNGQTTSTASGLSAGSYTITATSSGGGCSGTATVTITQPSVVTATATNTAALCNGGTGMATVTAGGGTPGYTYSWSNGATTSTITATAGTYTATVKDVNGCTITATTTITQPTAITTTTSTTPSNCASNNGTATVTAAGGTPGYTYLWSNGKTTSNITALSTGSYTVTVKDANNCTVTATVTVANVGATITATTTPTNPLCSGGTGSATVTGPTGGTAPYTYVWSNAQTSTTASPLTSGSYTVTITDANGCSGTETVTITVPTPVTATATNTAALCNGANGTATVTAGGGTPGYTYSWSNGATTSTINATAGTYTATVKDANGCTITATTTITQPTVVTAAATNTPPLCNGGTGTATVTAGGGTPGYTYSWSNGATTSTMNATAGTYTATVKDANGCTITSTTTITQPTAVTATASNTPPLCNGGNGTATVTAGGGTPGYTYSWSNGATTSTMSASAGTYTATVTDANGCTKTATTTITQPSAVTTTITSTPSNCSTNDGTATVTPAGGTPGYTYLWSNAQTASNATGLSTGSYTVTVKDANGCTATATVSVVNVGATITATTTPTNVLCNGGTGSATVTGATGGTGPYTYLWSNAQTTTIATVLTVGTYTVTITDANGCSGTETVTITQPTALTATAANTPALCNAGNGTATVTAGGGTPGYTYSWSNGATTSTITVTAGTYTATVTDANGCIITATTTITQPTALTATATNTPPLCNGGNGTATVTAGGGTPGYTYSWSNAATTSTITATAGTYVATVTDANGCTTTATTTITQPTALTASATNTPPLCNGGNGTATVTAGGGTPGYTYSWSNAATSSTMTATAGTYTATVTDANGCTITATTIIAEPTALTSTTSSTPSNCTSSNGSATVTAGGGTPGYSYSWNNGQTASTAIGLSPGPYTITVTDANGCIIVSTVTVGNVGATITPTITSTNVLCNGGNTGGASVTATGGTTPYTYLWSSAQTSSNITALTAGSYSVAVTDVFGCTGTDSVIITQPTQLRDSIISTVNEPCFGNSLGSITTGEKGGTSPYTYSWTPGGGTSQSPTGMTAGSYTVTVTDANGCTVTANATITQPTALTITAAGFPTSCFGSCDGQVAVIPAGGTTPYTYLWTPSGNTNASQPGMCAGTDSIYVTDNNGCKQSTFVTVTQPSAIRDSIVTIVNVLCNGGNNGSATVGATGGTPGYTYSWAPSGGTNATANNLTAGSYTCTVTDKDLCSNTVVATITEPPVLVATLPAPSTLCIGQSVTITATVIGGTPTYTYSWSNGATTSSITVSPVVTTSYSVTVTDANGCIVGPISITITVNPPLAVIAGPTKSICPGGTTTISATASGGDGTYTYVWTPGGMNGSSVNVSPGTTTTYTVTVNDGCGTPAVTATEAVIVDPLPVVSFTADTTNGCYPLCINFKDMTTITSGGVDQWQWTFGNGGTSSHADTTFCYMTPGVYTVGLTVTSDSGCSSSQTVPNMITVYNHPTAMFTSSPQPATIIEPTVTFTDQSTDDYGIVKWQWLFGDPLDGNSNLQNPSYTYADTGTYCPHLTVTNKYGCVDSITQCIVIEPFFTLYIPNAFSPNGDGVNDIFTAKGTYVCEFQMYIFDRWGMQLFYTEDMNRGWDGTVNGGQNVEQEDTYVYLIYAVDCIEHKKHSYIGKVSIVK